jgi:hypothetical protein
MEGGESGEERRERELVPEDLGERTVCNGIIGTWI